MAGWDDTIFGNLPPQIDWSAPPQPTLPSDPFHAPGYSFPSRLASYLNQRFVQPAVSAATLPGDVATGKTTMADPATQQRVMGAASQLVMGPKGGAEGGFATGWAPSAWNRLSQLKRAFPDKAEFIDGLANLTPDQARLMPPFGNPTHNALLDDVLNAHNDDLNLVDRVQGSSGDRKDFLSNALRQLRGQSYINPDIGLIDPRAPPPPDLPPTRVPVEPASTPWNTFKLQPPNRQFPANDPRGPGRPPGLTINSLPPPGFI